MRSDARSLPESWIAAAILVVTLLLNAVFGMLTTYVLLLLIVLGGVALLVFRRHWIFGADSRIFALSFVAIAALFAITAKKPEDLLQAVNFIAFLLYVPLATLMAGAAAKGNSSRVALLALGGAGVAAVIALTQALAFGQERAVGLASDPIRLADNAAICGFLALVGIFTTAGWRRWLYLLGPVFAVAVALATGTRIAFVSIPIMALVALMVGAPQRVRLPLFGLFVVVTLVAGTMLANTGNARFVSMFDTINQIATGARVADTAVRVRIELYQGAWSAFLQSPLVGHGWNDMMRVAAVHVPGPDRAYAEQLPHLHNELLNFAVFGGLAGVAVYLALIVTPIVLAVRSVSDSQKHARVFAVAILSSSYVAMGLTDTMLSFELHTMLYVALTAIILHYCRDAAEPQT